MVECGAALDAFHPPPASNAQCELYAGRLYQGHVPSDLAVVEARQTACVNALAALSCDALAAGDIPDQKGEVCDLNAIYRGAGGQGDCCRRLYGYGSDCMDGFYCKRGATFIATGTCEKMPSLGEPCEDAFECALETQRCSISSSTCVETKKENESCKDAPCGPGLVCDFGDTGLCIQKLSIGGDCTDKAQCASGFCDITDKCALQHSVDLGGDCDEQKDCKTTMFCDENKKCAAWLGKSDTCTKSVDGCKDGLICNGTQCVAVPDSGEDCDSEAGQFGTTARAQCVKPTDWCDYGLRECGPRRSEGADCVVDDECAADLYCGVADMCTPRPSCWS